MIFGMNPIRIAVANAPQAPQPQLNRTTPTGAPVGGGGFNNLAAGNKTYGSGRPMPTMGKVQNKSGYAMRDGKMAARRDALMRRAGGM